MRKKLADLFNSHHINTAEISGSIKSETIPYIRNINGTVMNTFSTCIVLYICVFPNK